MQIFFTLLLLYMLTMSNKKEGRVGQRGFSKNSFYFLSITTRVHSLLLT